MSRIESELLIAPWVKILHFSSEKRKKNSSVFDKELMNRKGSITKCFFFKKQALFYL